MEKIEKSLVKVRRHLMRQYGNEQALANDLKNCADSDKNGNLSVDEFKNFLINKCETSLIDKSITKSDLEGFMSAFIYNAQGQTSVDGVAPIIFCNDSDKMTRYLNQRYRANPPPAFIN
jgi:ligand-binding sensor protein